MAEDIKRLPDEEPEPSENANASEVHDDEHRHRKRIKIRKRIKQRVRVKKKPSVKKRIKKILGYLAWLIVLGGFLITVFVLVKELDIKDENAKKQMPKKKQGYLLPNKNRPSLLPQMPVIKKVIHFNQTEKYTALNSLA